MTFNGCKVLRKKNDTSSCQSTGKLISEEVNNENWENWIIESPRSSYGPGYSAWMSHVSDFKPPSHLRPTPNIHKQWDNTRSPSAIILSAAYPLSDQFVISSLPLTLISIRTTDTVLLWLDAHLMNSIWPSLIASFSSGQINFQKNSGWIRAQHAVMLQW